jgi:hypothetical protein
MTCLECECSYRRAEEEEEEINVGRVLVPNNPLKSGETSRR